MEDKCAFIADEAVIAHLLSEDHEKLVRGQLFLDYLAYRKYNKEVWLSPSVYKKIEEKLRSKGGEHYLYFNNWFRNGKNLIGESPSNSEKDDTISLYETLSYTHQTVFIISEKFHNASAFDGNSVLNMEELENYLKTKPDFNEHIFEKYYSGSY